jgi:hypothetical protein
MCTGYLAHHVIRKQQIYLAIASSSYMKDGLHAGNKMNSLARSNASLYAKQAAAAGGPQGQPGQGQGQQQGGQGQDELYDRLRRHAYQGKKSGE